MKKLRLFKDALLFLSAVSLISGAIAAVVNQVSFLTVTSRSMEPGIMAGDIVITKEIATASAQRNDIVVLPVPGNAQLRYAHRVFEVSQQNGEILIKTKGDANPAPDAWTMSISSRDIPQAIAVLPTSRIFNGPLGRRTLFYIFFFGGLALSFLGLFGLLRRRHPTSL